MVPRASFSSWVRKRWVRAPRAAGLNMMTVSFKVAEQAFVFSSNSGSVTFRREKNEPGLADRPGSDCGRGAAHFDRREHVCAVARDTSKDSAGTQPAPRHFLARPADQRHPVVGIEADRHHD